MPNSDNEYYDDGFVAGRHVTLRALQISLNDWKFNLLMRFFPKWTIQGVIKNAELITNNNDY